MGENIENRQSTSSGEVAGLQDPLKKGEQPPFKEDKLGRRECFGIGASSREVSGLQDLLTPFYTPQEGGGRRSGVYKRRILHEHNAEVPPRKRTKGSGIDKVKETRKAAVVDLSRVGDNNALNPKGSKCCKRVSTALEPYVRYMLRSWEDLSFKHPGVAESSIPLKWIGNIGGKCEQSEVSIGDLAGKAEFKKETGERNGKRSKDVEDTTGRFTDWAQVAAVERRKNRLTASSVKSKPVESIGAGGINSVETVEAGAASSLESEYSNQTNLDTGFIGAADSNVEEEVVDGFLFQASKTMEEENQLAEKEAQELHSLEARFGIEVLSFKEAKRVVSWWESRRLLHLRHQ